MYYAITSEQREQFEEDGYCIAKNVVTADAVAQLHAKITSVLQRGIGDGLNFDDKRTDGKNPAGPERYRKLARLGQKDPDIWDLFFCSDTLCSINQQFLGNDVRLWYDSVFTKPSKVGEATPWHQDISLWTQHRAQKKNRSRYSDALTVWMAIDRATRENGCLQVIPGSHKSGAVEHVRYKNGLHAELPREDVLRMIDRHGVRHIELDPADAIVWHSQLWHYSPPNLSDMNRLGIASVTLRDSDAILSNKRTLPAILLNGDKGTFPKKEMPSGNAPTARRLAGAWLTQLSRRRGEAT